MKDFGNDVFSGDCFDTVGKLKNLNYDNPKDFVGILEIINRDLHLGVSGDDDYASLVVSISPKPVRESKPNPAPPKKKQIHIPLYSNRFLQKKRRFGSNTTSHPKS